MLQILSMVLSCAAILGLGWSLWLSWSKGREASMKFARLFAPVWALQLLVAFIHYILGS